MIHNRIILFKGPGARRIIGLERDEAGHERLSRCDMHNHRTSLLPFATATPRRLTNPVNERGNKDGAGKQTVYILNLLYRRRIQGLSLARLEC